MATACRSDATVVQSNGKATKARQHFEKAAATDPSFSRAYSGLAVTYQMEALDLLIAAEGRGAYDMAFDCAKRALALDEADYRAHIARHGLASIAATMSA